MVDYRWELLVLAQKVGVVLNLGGIFNSGYCVNNPALTGIIADRWINAEKLYGILHILSGFAIFIYRKLMTLFSIG
jgi:uncharacterized membrane protein HdeD (DUF308 family)